MAPLLYSEIFVLVYSGQGQLIFGPQDLRSMIEHGIELTTSNRHLAFNLNFKGNVLESEVIVHVKVLQEDIAYSPLRISLPL